MFGSQLRAHRRHTTIETKASKDLVANGKAKVNKTTIAVCVDKSDARRAGQNQILAGRESKYTSLVVPKSGHHKGDPIDDFASQDESTNKRNNNNDDDDDHNNNNTNTNKFTLERKTSSAAYNCQANCKGRHKSKCIVENKRNNRQKSSSFSLNSSSKFIAKDSNSLLCVARLTFVDKLTRIIKKSSSKSLQVRESIAEKDSVNKFQRPEQITAIEKERRFAISKRSESKMQSKSSSNNSATSNRYLISEFSRRLVKRCALVGRRSLASSSTASTATATTTSTTTTKTAYRSTATTYEAKQRDLAECGQVQQASHTLTLEHKRLHSDSLPTSGGHEGGQASQSMPLAQSERNATSGSRQADSRSHFLSSSATLETQPLANLESENLTETLVTCQLPESHQTSATLSSVDLLAVATRANPNNTNININNNLNQQQQQSNHLQYQQLNSSTLTLSITTTPSTCGCLCDDSYSSSGFVSGSSASGANCNDSINTSHSCASSTYNEPVAGQLAPAHEYQSSKSPANFMILTSNPNEQLTLAELEALRIKATAQMSSATELSNGICAKLQEHLTQTPPVDKLVNKTPQQQQLSAKSSASKKKSQAASFLTRARNSTINLVALAGVTQRRFNCSASVGNLWTSQANSTANEQSQRSEVSDLTGDRTNSPVMTLEYRAARFDVYDDDDNNNNNYRSRPRYSNETNIQNCQSPDDANLKKQKSAKKKNHQKEDEKIEKLRLLVNYLKSGTSQQLINPIALEADELELAQRYKSHLILCEDCLQATERQHEFNVDSNLISAGLISAVSSSALPTMTNNHNQITRRSGSRTPNVEFASPSPSDFWAQSEDRPANVRKSSDQSGKLLAVPKHEHFHTDFSSVSGDHLPATGLSMVNSVSSPHMAEPQPIHMQPNVDKPTGQSSQVRCYRCNKATGRTRNSLVSSVDLTATASVASDIGSTFTSASNNNNPCIAASSCNNQTFAGDQPKVSDDSHLITGHNGRVARNQEANSCDLSDIKSNCFCRHDHNQSMSSSASTSNHHIGQMSWLLRRSISDPGGDKPYQNYQSSTDTLSHHFRKSSNQNLASWIDNEVNSLVHDLEAKSQIAKREKRAKRRWLPSSTSSDGSSRRNSSGAHST